MIKLNCRDKILSSQYSPNGKIMIEYDVEETEGYYVYIWHKDGTMWSNSEDEIVYDAWLGDFNKVKSFMKGWKIEWQDEKQRYD